MYKKNSNVIIGILIAVCTILLLSALVFVSYDSFDRSTKHESVNPLPISSKTTNMNETSGYLEVRLPVEWKKVRKDLLGFNQEYIALTGKGTLTRAAFANAKVTDAIRLLRPFVLRFPGGTLANFYDWQSDRIVPPVDFPALKKFVDKQASVTAGQQDFLQLCRQLKVNPLFVFNLYQPNTPDNFLWVQSLEEQEGLLKVKRWELGNEMNLNPWHPSRGWVREVKTVEEYVERARPLGKRLLEKYPNLLLAVNAESPMYLFSENPDTDFILGSTWNKRIANDFDYYNAVSMHVYLYHQPRWNASAVERTQWLCILGDILPEGLAQWHRRFFDNLPLWLTEFGVAGRDTVEHQTWGFGFAELNAILQLLNKPGPVTLVLKHLLCSQGIGRVAFQFQYNANNKESTLNWLPSGIAFRWLTQELAHSNDIGKLTFDDMPTISGFLQYKDQNYPQIFGIALRGDTSNGIFLVNRGTTVLNISLPFKCSEINSLYGKVDDKVTSVKISQVKRRGNEPYTLRPFEFIWVRDTPCNF
jgi:hypothetical protein